MAVSALVDGLTCYILNESHSVHDSAGLNVKEVIHKCLLPFPYIWASVEALTSCSCLIILHCYLTPSM